MIQLRKQQDDQIHCHAHRRKQTLVTLLKNDDRRIIVANSNVINYEEMDDTQFASHASWIANIIRSEKTATAGLLDEAARRIAARDDEIKD